MPAPKLVVRLKWPTPSPNRMDTSFETELLTARSWLPSLLKSPTATELGLVPTATLVVAKLIGLQIATVVTVRVNVLVAVRPVELNAVTVMEYAPAGCALVIRARPSVGSPVSVP